MRRHAVILRLWWAATVCMMLVGIYPSGFQASNVRPQPTQNLGDPLERADQTLYAVIGPLGSWAEVEIMLNNNSPAEMRVSPSIYVGGQERTGEDVVLLPAETRWIPVRDLIQGSKPTFTFDALELRYFGYLLDLRTQVVARRPRGQGSVDVLFTGRGEFRSATLASTWIVPPGGRAVITIGNTSDAVVTGRVEANGQSSPLRVPPHASVSLVRTSRSVKVGADSLIIASDGPVGALRAGGYVEVGGRAFGLVRFYDPGMAKRSDLFASNLRTSNTDIQVALLNTSDEPITAQPEIRPAVRTGATPTRLAPVLIPARKSVRIDTDDLDLSGLERATVHVASNGRPGSLVGYVAAIDRSTLTAYELPLREGGPMRQSTGNYPWRLDGDYSSIVSIANVGSSTASFSAVITYAGGVYQVHPEALPPGGTATFDLREIRDRQILGVDGRSIHVLAQQGQFKWSIVGPVNDSRLNGRMEVVSASRGHSSSYSCGQCCPDSYSYGILQPVPVWTPSGWSTQFTVLSQLRTCSGSIGGQSYAYAQSWHVQSPAVASVNTSGLGTADANGLDGGDTGIAGYWTGYEYRPYFEDCNENPVDGGGNGNVEVQIPSSLRVAADTYNPQQFNNYRRQRRYIVLDQNGTDIRRYGLQVEEIIERFAPDGCRVPLPNTGSGFTGTDGGFGDQLGITNLQGCRDNDQCTSHTVQTIYVERRIVARWPVVFGCSGVTINNQ